MMEQLFSYVIGLGAAVMMPILFTLLGVCIGIRLGDALKAGLKVVASTFPPLLWPGSSSRVRRVPDGSVCATLLLLVWNRRLIVRQQQHNTLK